MFSKNLVNLDLFLHEKFFVSDNIVFSLKKIDNFRFL